MLKYLKAWRIDNENTNYPTAVLRTIPFLAPEQGDSKQQNVREEAQLVKVSGLISIYS